MTQISNIQKYKIGPAEKSEKETEKLSELKIYSKRIS